MTTADIPSFYRIVFTWIDPIVTASSAWMGFADPQTIFNSFVPNTLRNPDLDMFFQQTAGWTLALTYLQAVMLRSTNDKKIWRHLQYATVIVDFVMLYSLYWGLSRQGRLSPSVWRGEDWGCFLITIWATICRLLFLAEVGFKTTIVKTRKTLS